MDDHSALGLLADVADISQVYPHVTTQKISVAERRRYQWRRREK
jgi:hypothetical protein